MMIKRMDFYRPYLGLSEVLRESSSEEKCTESTFVEGFLYCFDVSLLFSGTVSMHVSSSPQDVFPATGVAHWCIFQGVRVTG